MSKTKECRYVTHTGVECKGGGNAKNPDSCIALTGVSVDPQAFRAQYPGIDQGSTIEGIQRNAECSGCQFPRLVRNAAKRARSRL